MLTIDAGNTRIKWAVFDAANAIVQHGVCSHADLGEETQQPVAWLACHQAVIANVAGERVANQIRMLLGPDIEQLWVRAEASGFGITSTYEHPEQLGCDRWAAMIAARQYVAQSCIVVNAGTALTIDVLLRNELSGGHLFAGGVILPGYRLMQQVLFNGTHGIKRQSGETPVNGLHKKLPRNTEAAVQSGVLLAMTGAIEKMALTARTQSGSAIHCVLSGGDARQLLDQLQGSTVISDIVVIEDLILRGLLVMGRELL